MNSPRSWTPTTCGMPQRRGKIGLAVEPLAKLGIRRNRLGEDFDHVAPRQPGMQGQVDLGHAAGTQLPQDRVAGERRPAAHRHDATHRPRCGRWAGFRLRARGGTDRWNAAEQVRDGHGRQRMKARAQRLPGMRGLLGSRRPPSRRRVVRLCSSINRLAPSFLGTTPGIAAIDDARNTLGRCIAIGPLLRLGNAGRHGSVPGAPDTILVAPLPFE